jgi:TRAP-type C4-dicarboxylate transport system permease small subunit
MVQILLRGAHGLIAVIRATAAILLAASVAINFANIIGRYFFSVSIQWAEEIMLFLMIGCVFLGSSATVRQFLEVVVELVEIATCFFLAVLAWPVVSMLAELDQRSQAANFPLVIPQATMPIGFALMGLLIVVALMTQSSRAGEAGDRPLDH